VLTFNPLDRIVDFRRVPARDLIPDPQNPRVHPPDQLAALDGILRQVGFADAVKVRLDQATGNLYMWDGHARREEVPPDYLLPTLVTDLSAEEAHMMLALGDQITLMATLDPSNMLSLLERIHTEDTDLVQLVESLRDQSADILATLSDDDILTADDLSDMDEPDPTAFWPWVRLQVSPETHTHFTSLLDAAGPGTEADQLARVLASVDLSTLDEARTLALNVPEPTPLLPRSAPGAQTANTHQAYTSGQMAGNNPDDWPEPSLGPAFDPPDALMAVPAPLAAASSLRSTAARGTTSSTPEGRSPRGGRPGQPARGGTRSTNSTRNGRAGAKRDS
jgi:hypothetical protein